MTAPAPPAGAIPGPLHHRNRGEIACWRTPGLPALEISLRAPGAHGGFPGAPATVVIAIAPAGGRLDGITNPAELRRMAWPLLAAARWLDIHAASGPVEEPEHPQLTIDDYLEAHA